MSPNLVLLLSPLLLAALAPAARAAAPDRFAADLASTASATRDLVVSPDGLALLFADDGGGAVGLLDLRTWGVALVDACGGAAGIAIWEGSSETRIYTGCSDGKVVYVPLQDGGLGTLSDESVDVGDGDVLDVFVVGDTLYVLTDPDDGANPRLHSVDPDSGLVDQLSGFPTTTNSDGFKDLETTATQAFLIHGGDNLSKISLSSGSVASETNAVGVLEARDLVISSTGGSILAGGGAAVGRFSTGDNEWTLALGDDDGLVEVDSLQIMEDPGTLAVADGGQADLLLFQWDSTSGAPGDDIEDRLAWPDSGAIVSEMAVVLDDYLVAGTEDGQLWVATDRPWVEVSGVAPSSAVAGETVDLVFQSDTDGTYTVLLGATDNDSGTELASGSVTAQTSTTVQVGVTEDFVEGDNYLRVVVDDGSRAGHDSAIVSIDNPPSRISLDDDSVGVGDGFLSLSFTAPSDEDLATIKVWVTTTAFDRDDWASDGPDFDGEDALSTPIEVSVSPSESVEVVISPLTNGTTYYLAARAIDSGGLEGPMSTVVSGTPEETMGIAELSGEDGGFCGTGAGAASLLLTALGGLAAAGRRRRALLPLAALGILALGGADARAQEPGGLEGEEASGLPQDEASASGEDGTAMPETAAAEPAEASVVADLPTDDLTDEELAAAIAALPSVEELVSVEENPKVKNAVGVRFGPMWFDDGNPVVSVLGDTGHNVAWLEGGPVFWRVLQVSAGAGFYRKKGTLLTASGGSSTQTDLLWAVPVTANVAARLDVVRDQPLVPYASAGADYWFWRESWETDSDGNRSGVGGGKAGYHYALGGEILLDIFERGRADSIDARSGIRDSYLVVEYRHQEVGVFSDGLDLSNDQLTFGIRLHR